MRVSPHPWLRSGRPEALKSEDRQDLSRSDLYSCRAPSNCAPATYLALGEPPSESPKLRNAEMRGVLPCTPHTLGSAPNGRQSSGGLRKRIPGQAPGSRGCPAASHGWRRSKAERTRGEGSRQLRSARGKGISGISHLGSFFPWLPFPVSPTPRAPRGPSGPPRGRDPHLPRHCPLPPRSPREHEADTAELAPRELGRLIPAGHSPPRPRAPSPCPGGGLHLTGRVTGNGRTRFAWMHGAAGERREVSTPRPGLPVPQPQEPQTLGQHAAGRRDKSRREKRESVRVARHPSPAHNQRLRG